MDYPTTASDPKSAMEPVSPNPHRLPMLPPEVIDIILEQADDAVFLWATCRQVSSSFRERVESIFKGTWLRDTSFMWFCNGAVSLWGFEGHFTHIVGDSAFFKINVHHPYENAPVIPQDEILRNLYRFVVTHNQLSTQMAFFLDYRTVLRIGTDPNHSFFSDLPIPNLVIHKATMEISMDWKLLFTRIFREEQVLRRLKAINNISTPTHHPMSTVSPIVVEINHDEFYPPTAAAYREHTVRARVRFLRAKSLGWAIHVDASNVTASMSLPDTRLQVVAHAMRLQGLTRDYELEYADCRGMELAVEKPGENGWSKWKDVALSEHGNEWVGHCWENEGQQGTVCFAEGEDGVSWEVARMARGWERGMAW